MPPQGLQTISYAPPLPQMILNEFYGEPKDEDLKTHSGWGHSSWKQAVEISIKANAEKLVLFHFCPNYDDSKIQEIEKNAQNMFDSTVAAYQGLKIKF